jgi:hypothetical protein
MLADIGEQAGKEAGFEIFEVGGEGVFFRRW